MIRRIGRNKNRSGSRSAGGTKLERALDRNLIIISSAGLRSSSSSSNSLSRFSCSGSSDDTVGVGRSGRHRRRGAEGLDIILLQPNIKLLAAFCHILRRLLDGLPFTTFPSSRQQGFKMIHGGAIEAAEESDVGERAKTLMHAASKVSQMRQEKRGFLAAFTHLNVLHAEFHQGTDRQRQLFIEGGGVGKGRCVELLDSIIALESELVFISEEESDPTEIIDVDQLTSQSLLDDGVEHKDSGNDCTVGTANCDTLEDGGTVDQTSQQLQDLRGSSSLGVGSLSHARWSRSGCSSLHLWLKGRLRLLLLLLKLLGLSLKGLLGKDRQELRLVNTRGDLLRGSSGIVGSLFSTQTIHFNLEIREFLQHTIISSSGSISCSVRGRLRSWLGSRFRSRLGGRFRSRLTRGLLAGNIRDGFTCLPLSTFFADMAHVSTMVTLVISIRVLRRCRLGLHGSLLARNRRRRLDDLLRRSRKESSNTGVSLLLLLLLLRFKESS
tara:strand:- start:513 stop:1997 length:1485 start_codon:yes stop_codon:yes gene_type:complete